MKRNEALNKSENQWSVATDTNTYTLQPLHAWQQAKHCHGFIMEIPANIANKSNLSGLLLAIKYFNFVYKFVLLLTNKNIFIIK